MTYTQDVVFHLPEGWGNTSVWEKGEEKEGKSGAKEPKEGRCGQLQGRYEELIERVAKAWSGDGGNVKAERKALHLLSPPPSPLLHLSHFTLPHLLLYAHPFYSSSFLPFNISFSSQSFSLPPTLHSPTPTPMVLYLGSIVPWIYLFDLGTWMRGKHITIFTNLSLSFVSPCASFYVFENMILRST